jgi:hypothetical protein
MAKNRDPSTLSARTSSEIETSNNFDVAALLGGDDPKSESPAINVDESLT